MARTTDRPAGDLGASDDAVRDAVAPLDPADADADEPRPPRRIESRDRPGGSPAPAGPIDPRPGRRTVPDTTREERRMLVLGRKINETIVIGGDIRITLTAIRHRQVRIAIDAPSDVPILREELIPPSPDVAADPAGASGRARPFGAG